MPYDENFHFGVIEIFSKQLSPFILDQPMAYDIYGNLAHGDATLFHYFMSFPYRLILLVTSNFAVAIILLRLICIFMVMVGLILFNKLFKKIGIRQIFINIGLLLFVLLPITPFVAATINYDNLLFPLTALFLILCVDVINNTTIKWYKCILIVVVGCIASLVKYTFLPIFAASFMYIVVLLFRRHGKKIFSMMIRSVRSTNLVKILSLTIIFVLSVGMFFAVYMPNIVIYKSIRPSCERVMSKQRCEANRPYLMASEQEMAKDTRSLMLTPEYTSVWVLQMIDWSNMTGGNGSSMSRVDRRPFNIMYTTVFVGVFIGLSILLLTWRSMRKNHGWYFLVAMSLVLILSIFCKTIQDTFIYTH